MKPNPSEEKSNGIILPGDPPPEGMRHITLGEMLTPGAIDDLNAMIKAHREGYLITQPGKSMAKMIEERVLSKITAHLEKVGVVPRYAAYMLEAMFFMPPTKEQM
jgi:hypothetical protein